MLARLNLIPAVAEALVDATGRHFVLFPQSGVDLATAAEQILSVLGENSCQEYDLRDPGNGEALAIGELWFSAKDIRKLSLLEARMLAARWGGRAAADAGLRNEAGLRLSEFLSAELAREFNQVHDRGGTTDGDWYRRVFPAAFERSIARLKAITQSQADALLESLGRSLNE